MKPSDIKVGKTYVNRGAGRTRRTVLAIETWATFRMRSRDSAMGVGDLGGDIVVVFSQTNGGEIKRGLSLASFASWAGREVTT